MNEQLSHLKQQYKEIPIPSSLWERSQRILNEFEASATKTEDGKPAGTGALRRSACGGRWKPRASIAAIAAIVFLGGLNVSESFAATVAAIPGMDGLVRVLTMDRYQFSQDGLEADVVMPRIQGLANQELQDMINEEIRRDAEAVIARFQEDKEALEDAQLDGEAHMGRGFNYEVKTETDRLLVLDTYLYNVVGSSTTIHKYYNVDKMEGCLLTLPELMKEHPDYVKELSQYIRQEMIAANESGEGDYFVDLQDEFFGDEAFSEIAADQLFYINEDGQLVICFEKYSVAPGYMGSPEFVVPAEYYRWGSE